MPKLIDLTGKRFGKLVVLERGENYISPNGTKLTRWICQCDCGEIIHTTLSHLKYGHTKSCGCMKNLGYSKKILTGQRFGKLLVIEEKHRSKNGNVMWLCKCDCGNETVVNSSHLIQNHTLSCGCLHKESMKNSYEDLTNKKFGRLTALEKIDASDDCNTIKWKCICDCGTIIEVRRGNLTNGHTKSCGCMLSYGEEIIGFVLNQNNISFEKQFKPKDFKFSNNYTPRFDFIVDYNGIKYLIEYDGKTHFKFSNNKDWNTEDSFKKRRNRDLEKNKYCFENNIPIIRIPYTHHNKIKIEDLLLDSSTFILTKENEKDYYNVNE